MVPFLGTYIIHASFFLMGEDEVNAALSRGAGIAFLLLALIPVTKLHG